MSKIVIITGASRGIGRAAAERFLREGWTVIGTSRAGGLPFSHEQLHAVQLDLEKPESIALAAQKMLAFASAITVLVNNAGIILDAHDSGADPAILRKTFAVDVFGLVDLTERLLNKMKSGGHIINIDSGYGAFSVPIDDESSTAYRMAKAALNMYTRTLAFRLRRNNILVSSLDPGWVKTDMGNDAATTTDHPDREPAEAADDIFRLATKRVESGLFWRFGKKRHW